MLGRASKIALAKAGALGMISENTENPDLVDERGSHLLRDFLKKGPVKVRAAVDSCYYPGVYPYVTGVIRGTDGARAEEVLSLAHLYEQGAHYKPTGFASILGRPRRSIDSSTKASYLPKRSIRVLGMGECYGTMYYLEHNILGNLTPIMESHHVGHRAANYGAASHPQ